MQRNGKILMLGTDLTTCTWIHAVLEWSWLPKRPALRLTTINVFDCNGNPVKIPATQYSTAGSSSQFPKVFDLLAQNNAMRQFTFGNAISYILDCQRAADILIPFLKENPRFFG